MMSQPILSDEEWGVIMDLLLLEQRELPTEIHHVRNIERHGDLQHRRQLIDQLVERLQPMMQPAT